MQFIILHEVTIKKKTTTQFFQERIGCINVMVLSPAAAKHYDTKPEADADRKKYFGQRPSIKTITYEKDTDINVPGTVRHGHDSNIF